MRRPLRTLLTIVALAACASACDGDGGGATGPADVVADATAPDATAVDSGAADAAAPDTGASPDTAAPAADPAAPGRWLAGVRTIELTDPVRDRTVPVDVWYPVDPAEDDGADNAYELDIGVAVVGSFSSAARRDATPARLPAGQAGWPFVVFSHGFGGVRFQSAFFCEHLATHGFVVAAPDHVGNTVADLALLNDDEAVAQSSVDRPLDVILVRDALVADPAWPVDPDRVAVSGHSFGGWTCVETAARDDGFGAVVALAPGFLHGSSPTRAADVGRPILIFAGTADRTTPFVENQEPAYEAAAPPRLLVTFADAGHFDFTHLCEIPAAAPIYDGDGCDADVLDWTTVFAGVNTIGTAFLLRHLNGDARYEAFLETGRLEALGGLTVRRDDGP